MRLPTGMPSQLAHTCCSMPCTHAVQGKFVTFYGKNFTADEMAQNISDHVKRWQAEHPQWG